MSRTRAVAAAALAVLLLVLPGPAGAQAPTITTGVTHYRPQIPNSGPITSLAVDPANDRTVLAASETGGLFRSRDGGLTWLRQDVPTTRTEGVRYMATFSSLACPCAIATGSPDFEAADGGGAWLATVAGERPDGTVTWNRLRSIFPAPGPRCPPNPGAHEIAVAPDTGGIYIATDCGLAIGTPNFTFRTVDIPGPASPAMLSVAALPRNPNFPGRHLIAAGPSGVFYSRNDGMTWTRTVSLVGGVSDLHALAADPRGIERAYLVNDQTDLFETLDGGRIWRRVPAPRGGDACGGVAHVRAVLAEKALHLYFGNRCDTKTASVPPGGEPYAAVRESSWQTLAPNHGDTRDIVFRPITGAPYLVSTDGGVHLSQDGRTFGWVGGPAAGLDADQVTEVTGQYRPGRPQPDLYFATQHNDVWAMDGERVVGNDGAEGFGMGVFSHLAGPGTDRMVYSTCLGCRNNVSDMRLQNPRLWRDAQRDVALPLPISPGRHVQAVVAQGGRLRRRAPAGLRITDDEGRSWRQIADIPEPQVGLPRVSQSRAAGLVLTQAYAAGLTAGGAARVRLLRLTRLSASRAVKTYARMRNFGGIGVTLTAFASYQVYAVDPNNPNRIIAPDVLDGAIRRTKDGGDEWSKVEGSRDLVTHNGRYLFAKPFTDNAGATQYQPLVSTISICPYNSARVLAGSRQGGAYLSLDGGASFSQLDATGPIVYATSIFWLEGCGAAYISTYGRGIYRIDTALTTRAVAAGVPCDPQLCRVRDIAVEAVKARPPGSGPIESGVLVSDGAIRSVATASGKTRVTVTPGSIVTFYRKPPPGLDLRYSARARSRGKVLMGVLFGGGDRVDIKRELHAYVRLARHRLGKGRRKAPGRVRAVLEVTSRPHTNGTAEAVLRPDQRLRVRGRIDKKLRRALELTIDGRKVAAYPKGTTRISYATTGGFGAPGRHTVLLGAERGKKRTPLAAAFVLIGHEDKDEK